MNNQEQLDKILSEVAPVMLPPADYPPATIVRDTPREELEKRIRDHAQKAGIDLSDEHWEVIHFLFDFYTHCTEDTPGSYLNQMSYWKYVDCDNDPDCVNPEDHADDKDCPYGQLSAREAINGYRVFRILSKAFRDKGGKRHLYRLFPLGPIFTIHLLAQLPRLLNDVDPHYGTAF